MEATGLAGRIDGHHRQTRLGQLSCAMIPLTLTGLRNRGWLDHHRSIINSINQTTNLAILTRTRDELDAVGIEANRLVSLKKTWRLLQGADAKQRGKALTEISKCLGS